MSPKSAMEPEDFDVCPILLTQPAEDRWSPYTLVNHFFNGSKKSRSRSVMLENAGHYPLGEPSLTQMPDATFQFVNDNLFA